MNNPVLLVVLIAASLYVGKLWRDDLRSGQVGASALPGATKAPPRALLISVLGALALLAVETMGEISLGLAAGQSTMTWLFALYSITGAPMIEELVFRGWLVVENRGKAMMWSAAAGASLVFAALHPFLWRWDDAGFALTINAKGWFSTVVVFATSLWLYVVRLAPWNPKRSLLPCVAGHAAKNLGVIVVKAATGFMGAPW